MIRMSRSLNYYLFQVLSGSEENDDINQHTTMQKNYNISVPVNANCSFTVCYEGTYLYELMRGTTATCHTTLPRK